MITDVNCTRATSRTMMSRPLKRTRACMNCRFLKIKCDGMKPICGPCRKHPKDDECEYSDGPARSRTKALEETVERLEARLHELEHPEGFTPSVTLYDPYALPQSPPQLTISSSCPPPPSFFSRTLPNTPYHQQPRVLSPTGSFPESHGYTLLSPFSPPPTMTTTPPIAHEHTSSPLGIFESRVMTTPESTSSSLEPDHKRCEVLLQTFRPHASEFGFFLDWNRFIQSTVHPILPDGTIKGRVTQDDQYPFANGGNSNIYRGTLTRPDGREIRVAMKMLRMPDDSDQVEDFIKKFRREMHVWSPLKHKNIVPLIGVCEGLTPLPVLISPFYEFGHVGTYLKNHPEINRQDLVLGVGSGLEFLHANDIVHGDLKPQNVLVDKQGTARICDFGISKILNRSGFTTCTVGTAPYMAPELLFVIDGMAEDELPSTTKSSDVYSFGLVALEILTSLPSKGRPSKAIVTAKMLAELRPKRADYDVCTVKPETWSVLDQCWAFEPQQRPPISQVLPELGF
ncbi:kinase-like domain-containing protein [Mycena galericulata]|nr:kinase-like domain-containing protein [Mycena galericulata]